MSEDYTWLIELLSVIVVFFIFGYFLGINYQMNNRDQIKAAIQTIGIEKALQCLIESIDENTDWSNAPVWKSKLIENLEDAYNSYMDNFSKETSDAS